MKQYVHIKSCKKCPFHFKGGMDWPDSCDIDGGPIMIAAKDVENDLMPEDCPLRGRDVIVSQLFRKKTPFWQDKIVSSVPWRERLRKIFGFNYLGE
jgi:hypothetical protein